ncbi:MAG: hemolysin family protein [Bacteroidota bacterium]|jgi:putative hemolysin|nr:HlyC/CorC family transporter [Cytophagales bacterium]MCE2955642.1 hemolysin family protein [Flammeovirgaceae bacterium]MCZ8072024.1 hemolysin family protein [Cytophagales bacterium]
MDSVYIMIFATLVFSFFFSGIEIAFLSANKLQIELQAKQGVLWGEIMSKFMKNPSRFIGTTLIGNTLALVLFGIYMAQLIEPWLTENLPTGLNDEVYVLAFQTLISTLFILFTAEFLPKSLFLINPNAMLAALAVPFRIIYVLLAPLTFSIVYLSKQTIIHILRIEYSEEKPLFGLTDLNHYLKNMMKVRHEDEEIDLDKKILSNALEFKTVRIRDCMIPRTEVTAISAEDGIEKLKETFVQSGHSKILIYKETIDDVIGYCHSAALFKNPGRIEDILTPIPIVQETMMANDLMVQLIKERKSIALVVDEFGGTSGIVSMEDVIEEIFGEIEDEHDDDDLIETQIDAQTFRFSARLEVDYLNEKFKLQLPTGEYETLAGLILAYTEDFPQTGDTVLIEGHSFTIEKTENKRIDVVKLAVNNPES